MHEFDDTQGYDPRGKRWKPAMVNCMVPLRGGPWRGLPVCIDKDGNNLSSMILRTLTMVIRQPEL